MSRQLTASQFWEKTRKDNECWLWTGATCPAGYGSVFWDGRVQRAHRVAFMLATGITPPPRVYGKRLGYQVVMHSCDRPSCINPAHLSLGSQTQNQLDAVSRGRYDHVPKGGAAKLTADDVTRIRCDAAAGVSQHALARRFSVSQPCIGYVIRRKTWAHVA